jgi:hypothetical protein
VVSELPQMLADLAAIHREGMKLSARIEAVKLGTIALAREQTDAQLKSHAFAISTRVLDAINAPQPETSELREQYAITARAEWLQRLAAIQNGEGGSDAEI